jgi:hypothetical protein
MLSVMRLALGDALAARFFRLVGGTAIRRTLGAVNSRGVLLGKPSLALLLPRSFVSSLLGRS